MNQPGTKWYQVLLTPQTVIYVGGALVATVIFWIRTKESWDKVKELERMMFTKANVVDVKAIDEKVNKQYTTQREVLDRLVLTEKQIEYNKGYEQAKKDFNIK
jgi:hypothetical protein